MYIKVMYTDVRQYLKIMVMRIQSFNISFIMYKHHYGRQMHDCLG